MPKHILESKVLSQDAKLTAKVNEVSATVIKNNFSPSATPSTSDDSSDGYSIGSKWIYKGITYVCMDATVGSAQWFKLDVEPKPYTTSGIDMGLLAPNDEYTTPANFSPITDGVSGECLLIGNKTWNYLDPNWVGINSQSSYGSIRFTTSPSSAQAWTSIASASNNGLKTFNLPKNSDYDSLGGYFTYFFDSDAWKIAFLGTTSDVIIAQNGDVFKGSIAPENLVVDHKGNIGPAGRVPYQKIISGGTTDNLVSRNASGEVVDSGIAKANVFLASRVTISTSAPTAGQGSDGDLWFRVDA